MIQTSQGHRHVGSVGLGGPFWSGRRLDAREQLRTAFEMFNAMGIEAFAGRAERELLAAGERVRTQHSRVPRCSPPKKLRFARLARDSLSNAEVRARLFNSQHNLA